MESGFSALKGRKALARGAALGTSDFRFAPSPRREVVRSGEPASRAGESGGSVGFQAPAPASPGKSVALPQFQLPHILPLPVTDYS